MGISPRRINEIVLGKRAITVDTALGLADVFGLSPHYWMALQADYDIETARALRSPRDWRVKPRCGSREYASDPFDAPSVPVFAGHGMGTQNRL
jgi:plasmid maintenance system antidote protein VapI